MNTGTQTGHGGAVRRSCPPSSEYYKACRTALREAGCPARAFFEEIGIDPQTAVSAGLGFDPEWIGFPYAEPGPAVIIPLRSQDYQAYRLDSDRNPWGIWGIERAWHLGLMFTSGLHFITTGVFDALAIRECGWDACAVLGADNDNRFLAELDERGWKPEPDSAYIIAMGKYPADQEGAERLAAALRERGASVFVANLYEGAERVYEARKNDPAGFCRRTEKAVEEAVETLRAEGVPVSESWLEKKTAFPKPSLRLPGRRLKKSADEKTTHQYMKKCRQWLWEADPELQARFEKGGIKLETALQAGLGVDLEKSSPDPADPLVVVVPLPKKQYMLLNWGENSRTEEVPEGELLWQKQNMTLRDIIYITRDVVGTLIAMECGQTAVGLLGDGQELAQWLSSGNWHVSHDAVFVIALDGSEKDIRDADDLLKAFKAQHYTATRAAIRGEAGTLAEEYRRSPETVKKRFALATKKCMDAVAAKRRLAAQRAAKWHQKKKHPLKKKRRAPQAK